MTELLRRRALVERAEPAVPLLLDETIKHCVPCQHVYLADNPVTHEPVAWPTGVGWYDAGAA